MKLRTLMVGLALCWWTTGAMAEPCSSDSDCGSGEVCVWSPCPAIDCAPGSSCPEPNCPQEGTCEQADSDVYWGEACDTDADCPSGFVCEESGLQCETYACGCACAPCEDGTTCPPCECDCPEPPPCEESTITVCAFKPQACSSDADCAEGFACEAEEICYGGTGCACAEPAPCACPECPPGETCEPCECPEPQPCDCPEPTEGGCEVVGSYCQPQPIPCDTASDCPTDWECATIATGGGVDCACAGCACDPSMGSCDTCPPCDCPEPEPSETLSICMPRGWTGLLDSDTSTSGGATRGGSPAQDFAEEAADADPSTFGGNANSNDGSEEAGCSITSPISPSRSTPTWPLVLMMGAAAVLLRKRRA